MLSKQISGELNFVKTRLRNSLGACWLFTLNLNETFTFWDLSSFRTKSHNSLQIDNKHFNS